MKSKARKNPLKRRRRVLGKRKNPEASPAFPSAAKRAPNAATGRVSKNRRANALQVRVRPGNHGNGRENDPANAHPVRALDLTGLHQAAHPRSAGKAAAKVAAKAAGLHMVDRVQAAVVAKDP